MIKALLLIFEPAATWDGILRTRRGIVSILAVHLLPLLLLASACGAYGLIHWGKWQGDVRRLKTFSVSEAVLVEAVQFLLSLVVVFAGAKMVKSIGETFRGRHTYTQAFEAVAYSLSPLFLFQFFDAFTGVSPWVTWAIGITLSITALYHGIPRMMEPDPAHAFGLYLTSALLLALVTALARYVPAEYLRGKFPVIQATVADLIGRLPF